MDVRKDVPEGWVSEAELAAVTGVGTTEEDRHRFHRNLLNWRHHGLLPQCYAGHKVPFIVPLGFGVGNEAFYPPITIAMVRRINELRQHSKNMDKWLWQLWLERYLVDIIEWCRRRLIKLQPLASMTAKELVDEATRKPGWRSDPRRSYYRRLMARGWLALMTWAVNVAIGARPPESLHDPVSPPRSALARLFGLSTDPSIVGAGVAGSQIEDMSITRLLAVLNEEIGVDELEKVREDCWVLSHSYKVRTLPGRVLAAMWGRLNCRAGLLPALVILHRSPDHQATLLEVVKRYSNSPIPHQFEIPRARR
jgi:hypothetical protein